MEKVLQMIFWGFSLVDLIKKSSSFTSKRAVFAEKINRIIEDNQCTIVFEQGDIDSIDVLPSVILKYNNTDHWEL